MKKTIKIVMLSFTLLITLTVFGLNNYSISAAEPTEPFTVTFVDYDGTVLKEISCNTAPCDIVPPSDPHNKENSRFLRWSVFEEDYSTLGENTEIRAIYNLDNRLVTIAGRDIVFYSFFIVMGIIVALSLGLRETERIGMKKDDLLDGFLWIVPVAILGARLWYVAFEFGSFVYGGFGESFLRVIGFKSGELDFSSFGLEGLAIHGAFFTAIILSYFYTRKKEIDVFKMLDIVAIGFIIAQAFGRWGNFFNQEAHGGLVGGMSDGIANLTIKEQFEYLRYSLHIPEFIVNNMFMANESEFVAQPGFYHPTFFYESMLNLIGFSIMLILRRVKKIYFGEIFAFYLIWYGSVRVFIETMRTDPLTFQFLGLTLKSAIVTSILMILGGIAISVFVRMKRKSETYAKSKNTFKF
ncbi:MAG: prolipoprotein diacylglyceryl transferase [Tenericutes bacterium]|jgi:phosphatidylglycerol:prolipoprotein diacylglycerol transferase|nr:prolipoprotein diacylglyceryl transferase [Mycoplasmatota bacterium]